MILKMVKINETHNDIEHAWEICIRMHDNNDYDKLDELVSNYSGTHKTLLYKSDLYYGSPSYIYINLDNYRITNTNYNAGIEWKIESGKHLEDDVFDGVYEEIYDVKVDFGIIKKMLETKKVLLKSHNFYSFYKNNRNNIYENIQYKYINNITNEKTNYPYRLKTEEEFIKDFTKKKPLKRFGIFTNINYANNLLIASCEALFNNLNK
jgi:hypothetical protein